tara:strand:- start:179 stop:1438 length:1260 start_codon:yes stop_codon:yes gene_type:complete
MSLYDKASVALIPSGTKASKLYSVLPANGNGDFTHSRGSTATRVNKDGLIESVATNVPRLEYPLTNGVVGDCPHLLLEPSRTNDFERTEEFDNSFWSKSQASITANDTVSPDGSKTADKLVEDSSTNFHRVFVSPTTTTATYTFSVFAKADEREFLVLRNNLSGANINACFNLTSGSITFNGFSGDAEIENYGNGWFRCSATETDPSGGATTFSILLSNSAVTNNTIPSYTGDGSSGLHIWGAQLEQGSYPTSYIPWDGSGTTTRSADVCNGSGTSAEFNDSEGVLFAEIAALSNDGTSRRLGISDSSSSDRAIIGFTSTSNQIQGFTSSGGSTQSNMTHTTSDATAFNKIALKYKANDFALWINGTEVGTDGSGTAPSGLIEAAFDDGTGGSDFYGKVKQVIVFNEALSDSELATLTS